ncbi:mandelate racemase/muconate lactonizing enzyme family protein [Mycobacterium sp. KBS0706]|uniref:mandelate racemase/muconate lactonizing enzyme family protein n=1 Tax=Mycobacterium sp. KBS0706 TaxID=2578109 RepID=UPI001C8F2BF8|nr:mandelate racemase/muconate lactonizing enzyme family protein [Mycobacterium sp. KBS0706]
MTTGRLDDAAMGRVEDAASTHSRPSELRITDLRVAVVVGSGYHPIIRIDTNQGISGLGEVRDGGHAEYALQFKHMLLGQNPCNVDMIFSALRRYGNWGREGGGVSGIEIALWDLVGKAYGVPCHQFLGGKHRDRVRIYGDTPAPAQPTPEGYVEAVLRRKALGLTFIKFDLPPRFFNAVDGALVGQATKHEYDLAKAWRAPGAGRGIKLSQKGIAAAVDVVRAVREAVGPEISLCIDHFGEGFVTADEAIRLGHALEPFDLAWVEDPLPWHDFAGHKKVADALLTPVAAGEELYLWDGFREPIETRAFDILHPDLLTSGGMLETKRIADYGERFGLSTALHACCTPIGLMANVHCGAAISGLVAVEHHGLDLPHWGELVTGIDPDYLEGGYVTVPDTPGLGIELNEEAVAAQLRHPGALFQPTEEWNRIRIGFERRSRG